LSQSRRNQAQGLLDYTNDVRCMLNDKYLLAQIRLARLYARKASDALDTIQAMPVLQAALLNI